MEISSKSTRSISAFFPCYNEEQNVRQTYDAIARVLEDLTDDYEILFVDDGSTDATADIVRSIAQEDSRVRLVSHERNLGYGSALRSGFSASTKDVIFYSDCDGQFDLRELRGTLHFIEGHHIVSGYRRNRSEGMRRKLNAWVWEMLVLAVLRRRIRDVDCAFKIYRREIFDDLELRSTGALIDAEVLVRSLNRGYSLVQVGVSHHPRKSGVSTGANPRVVLRALIELYTLRNDIRHDKRQD